MNNWATMRRDTRTRKANAPRMLPVAAACCLGAILGLASPAAAQGIGNSPLGPAGRAALEKGAPAKPVVPAPEAVPGARAREPAAPATRLSADMSPNDALFDSINRGDIAGVRDALNRGAELNAVNILGMTPMELSVDLGRNDISFLLLSMRGEDSDRGSRLSNRSPAPAGKSAPPTPAGRQAARSSAPAKAATANSQSQPAKPVATPKLFANDGGTPLPNAGFLGFDNRR